MIEDLLKITAAIDGVCACVADLPADQAQEVLQRVLRAVEAEPAAVLPAPKRRAKPKSLIKVEPVRGENDSEPPSPPDRADDLAAKLVARGYGYAGALQTMRDVLVVAPAVSDETALERAVELIAQRKQPEGRDATGRRIGQTARGENNTRPASTAALHAAEYVRKHGAIAARAYAESAGLSVSSACCRLKAAMEGGLIEQTGTPATRSARWVPVDA